MNTLPEVTALVKFSVDYRNFAGFSNWITDSSADCVINALHFIGAIDGRTANILRATCAGTNGVTTSQIEQIFTIMGGYRYVFGVFDSNDNRVKNIEDFMSILWGNLLPNEGVLVGHTSINGTMGHVVVIAKGNDDWLYYIDPQLPRTCRLYPNNPTYQRLSRYRGVVGILKGDPASPTNPIKSDVYSIITENWGSISILQQSSVKLNQAQLAGLGIRDWTTIPIYPVLMNNPNNITEPPTTRQRRNRKTRKVRKNRKN